MPTIPRFLAPSVTSAVQTRRASGGRGKKSTKTLTKKRAYKYYRTLRLDNMPQFSLCDAMRYCRAFEVGQPPTSVKYELHVHLRALKNGPVIKDRIRLPHPVKDDVRVGVICGERSALGIQARQAGAVAVGEESIFEMVRQGHIPFTLLLCDHGSADKLAKANLGRQLGPKGLMPNVKQKTITSDVLGRMRELYGAVQYKEKLAVVRIGIGQLAFSPKMLADNIQAFMAKIKADMAALDGNFTKEIHEVVLSTTNGPGFSLNGGYKPTEEGITPEMLSTTM